MFSPDWQHAKTVRVVNASQSSVPSSAQPKSGTLVLGEASKSIPRTIPHESVPSGLYLAMTVDSPPLTITTQPFTLVPGAAALPRRFVFKAPNMSASPPPLPEHNVTLTLLPAPVLSPSPFYFYECVPSSQHVAECARRF